MGFRYDIQGIRAIAVLFVFLFHLSPKILPGGFVGVDVFFVISGFLVSSIILYKKENDNFKFLDFYLGRIKRIVPLFLFFLLAVSFIGVCVYLGADLPALRKNIFWAALFNSNNYFATLDNYFGASSKENPLLHTWTLSIEMQFYILLPFFIFWVNRRYIYIVCVVVAVVLLSYSFYNSTFLNSKGEMYFSLLARIPEFLVGVIAALKQKELARLFSKFKEPLALISILVLCFSAFLFSESLSLPGFWVMIPCISTGILLVISDTKVSTFLSNKTLVHIGELSYSIYLWHWATMAFLRYYWGTDEFSFIDAIMIVIGVYFVSYLSYTYVENHYRKLTDKQVFVRLSVIGICIVAVVGGMSKINSYISPIPIDFSAPVFGMKSHANTFERVERFGDLASINDSIALIGDSHALVYKRFIDVIGKEKGFSFSTITNNLYPTIPFLAEKDFSSRKLYNQYTRLLGSTDSLIENSKIIILSSIWSEKIPSLNNAFRKVVDNLRNDQTLIVLGDFPIFEKNPLKLNRDIIKNEARDIYNPVKVNALPGYIQRAAKQKENVKILNLDYSRILKDVPFLKDTIMYYDSGHLNLYGSEALGRLYADEFYDFIKQVKLR